MRLDGGYAAVILAAALRLEGITLVVMRLVGGCPSALSRGLSVSATLGMQATKRKRVKDANDHKKSVKYVRNRRSGVLLRRLACYYENILLVLLSILRLL